MPDLLSHALVAFVLGTLLSWRLGWLDPRYVTLVMAGAFVPDLAKIALALPAERVAATLDVPFDWFGLHTAGGAALAILVGVVLVPHRQRRRVATLLSIGAASHLLADALLLKASGHSYPLLWPLTDVAPPTPGLYLSTDLWPSVVLGGIALVIWVVDRRVVQPYESW